MFIVRLMLPLLIARFTADKLLTSAFFAGAASLVLIPLFEGAAMLALISFVFGLGMGCGHPLMIMLMFSNAPKGRSAEALGLRMTVNHLSRMVGPVIFGSIASAFGLLPIFWINALMLGTGGMLNRSKKAT